MSGQPGGTNITTRKKRRGMIEKRRRDKINNSLCELRRLVPAAFEKQGSAKLEKAEILQMTVDYLRMLHARGLADSLLTTGKNSVATQQQPNEDSTHPNQDSGSPKLTTALQDQEQLQQSQNSGNSTNNLSSHLSVQHRPILDHHSQLSAQPITPQIQHNNSLHHQGIASTPVNTSGATTHPSIHHSPAAATHHHHLYNQHHMSAVEHAAAAYHHLSNPHLGTADMTGMMSHTSGSAAQYHNHQQQHHHHHQESLKHQMKMESHQSPLVISHSHPSLLNLDHHHHPSHHQAHQSHNHPLSAHYGSHHHHPSTSLAMNPYLAATAAAAVAYPSMSAVGAAANQLPSAANHMDALHCQPAAAFSDQQQQSDQHNTSGGSNNSHIMQHLTQVQADNSGGGGGGTSSPSADANGHQQVSSSSSPSDSTSNTSTAAQRHYRPWGTELAY